MLEENGCRLVIMLCPCKESDKDMSAEYFPSGNNKEETHEHYKVKLLEEKEEFPQLMIREIEVANTETNESF